MAYLILSVLVVLGTLLLSAPTLLDHLRPTFPVHQPSSSAVFITGTSTGIGRALAARLAALGYLVLGTVRKQADADMLKKTMPNNFTPVLCDVADGAQIVQAVSKVQEHLDQWSKEQSQTVRLVGVVNNAGIMNELQDLDSTKFSKMLEVNVLAPYRVAEAFMPLLLKCEGSRLINVGSYFGTLTTARHAEYAASKHANEGLADALRRRFVGKGVSVSLVKPGNIASEMNKESAESSPAVVEDAVVHALGSNKPKARYYPGNVRGYSCWLLCHLFWALPETIADLLM